MCLFLAPNFALADKIDRIYFSAAKDFHELYRDTSFRDQADNWLKTIRSFKQVYEMAPGHKRAPQSLLNIGLLYRSLYKWNHNQSNIDDSSIYFRKLASEYPRSKLADDGQYRLAENYELYFEDESRAYLEYKKVVELFPRGDFIGPARTKLKELKAPPQAATAPKKAKGRASSLDELYKAREGGKSYQKASKSKKVLVRQVDYWSSSDWSRMVINVKNPVHYKYQVLKADKKAGKGRRMYLDIYRSYLPKRFNKKIAAKDGLITQARVAQFNTETVRIVLDLASLDKIKVFHLELPNQYKVIIDMLGESASSTSLVDDTPRRLEPEKTPKVARAKIPRIEVPYNPPQDYETNTSKSKKRSHSPKVEEISLSKALGLKVRKVIIDAGHGGKDPGASGYKQREKDLALKLAKRLKNIIEKKHPKIEVMLTRTKDKYISLEARTAFANQNKGDLFISIHLNASRKKNVSGMETYYLNLSKDNAALALAAKENQTSVRGIAQLQGLLQDLMTNAKIQESSDLAQMVQAAAIARVKQSKMISLRNLGVKKAPFVVLLGANMPSILVEAGFISNYRENKLLRKGTYQQVLAEGIYRGVHNYMKATHTL
ncbi:MAG: N-acetylmuramoyl-L-alanine amidase [SAR324 cluster bacterium]|nr:N-acetylmuramoyl-L-alanine amidase [SAR324 cluster bacterium]